jgi:non-heme chloroperoxidase
MQAMVKQRGDVVQQKAWSAKRDREPEQSVVFAAAVTPCLMQSPDNPDGPLTPEAAHDKRQALASDRTAFFEQFTRQFFSAQGELRVTEAQRVEALGLCKQSAQHAALACMDAFGGTDFREDLRLVTVPTLVIHGDSDAIVPWRVQACAPIGRCTTARWSP